MTFPVPHLVISIVREAEVTYYFATSLSSKPGKELTPCRPTFRNVHA